MNKTDLDEEIEEGEKKSKKMWQLANKVTSLLNELEQDYTVTQWPNCDGIDIKVGDVLIYFNTDGYVKLTTISERDEEDE